MGSTTERRTYETKIQKRMSTAENNVGKPQKIAEKIMPEGHRRKYRGIPLPPPTRYAYTILGKSLYLVLIVETDNTG